MNPLSDIPGIRIVPKKRNAVTPYYKIIANMMYGDGDMYQDVVFAKFNLNGELFNSKNASKLSEIYGRKVNIFDAMVVMDAIVGRLEEDFATQNKDYTYTYENPALEFWLDNINFEHEMVGMGGVDDWSLLYVHDDYVTYAVDVTYPENFKEQVEEFSKNFRNAG